MNNHCPVCTTEVPPYHYEHPNGARIQCLVCGTYRIMERAHQLLGERQIIARNVLQPNRRLSGALRQRAERGEEPVLSDPDAMEKEFQSASDPLEIIDRILQYMRTKSPAGGHKFVPLIGHRDYAVGGAEEPEAFDHALAEAVEMGYIVRQARNEAAYRLTHEGWKHLRTLSAAPTKVKRIFLSHAAADTKLAQFVQDELTRSGNGVKVFVASRVGDIRADEDWLPAIQRELQAADAYCVLLTPISNGRPWVWFETGAAWMSGEKWVIARAGGLVPESVPLPLSIRQTYSLDDAEGAREIFRALDLELSNPAAFADSMTRLAEQTAEAARDEDGWKGVSVGNVFYAWEGPLTGLPDLEPEAEPRGLLDALRANGLTPTWSDQARLSKRIQQGKHPLFATDRRTFRRKITQGGNVLIVAENSSAA
jgi:hypothetical protein